MRFSTGVNLISGANGAGKTSVLEALFLLGRGRSFRTRIGQKLVCHDAQKLWVFGRNDKEPADAGGLEITPEAGTRARLNAKSVASLADLAMAFPVQVIDAEIHKLVEDSSNRRRRWLDWAVFHVEQTYTETWRQYSLVIRQRNAALKSQTDTEAWDIELAKLGESLHGRRERFYQAMLPYWTEIESELLGLGVELRYSRGWSVDCSLLEALRKHKPRDQEIHFTSVGAHRADLVLKLARQPAKDVLSRGQQKLAAIALTLAQLQCLRDTVGLVPTLLLDDPAAELDAQRLAAFIDHVGSFKTQLVITSLTREATAFGIPDLVFHVEHGRVELA
jgi:DNA replication and repair protein RecF